MAKKSMAPLDAATRERLREELRTNGDVQVARAIGLARGTLLNAAAGGIVQRGTAAAITKALS
jgi:hypothetical protein